ncbi:hypothetical protein [Streptomyces sp. 1222.5]|uniref:hypothetical protein n=1 Tax=Streptomyces sp. 1222.5 TaxID=1881026 RepID=UPI003D7400CB
MGRTQIIGVSGGEGPPVELSVLKGISFPGRGQGQTSLDRLIFYSDNEYADFNQYLGADAQRGVLLNIKDNDGPIQGLALIHGLYLKMPYAKSQPVRPTSLIDSGWGLRSLDPSLDVIGVNEDEHRGIMVYNAIQKTLLYLVAPQSLVAEILVKGIGPVSGIARRRYFLMICPDPYAAGFRNEQARKILWFWEKQENALLNVPLTEVRDKLNSRAELEGALDSRSDYEVLLTPRDNDNQVWQLVPHDDKEIDKEVFSTSDDSDVEDDSDLDIMPKSNPASPRENE